MPCRESEYCYYVYILTNKVRTVLYVGMTDNLALRLSRHKQRIDFGENDFAAKYNACYLLYFERFVWIQEAISREKEMKKWRREKKIELIRIANPKFTFLNNLFEISPSSK